MVQGNEFEFPSPDSHIIMYLLGSDCICVCDLLDSVTATPIVLSFLNLFEVSDPRRFACLTLMTS